MQMADNPQRPTAGDYFVVSTGSTTWWVSTAMARHIEATIDKWPRTRWVTFIDLSGARVRVRVSQVNWILQSTVEQRAFDRALTRALHQEATPCDEDG